MIHLPTTCHAEQQAEIFLDQVQFQQLTAVVEDAGFDARGFFLDLIDGGLNVSDWTDRLIGAARGAFNRALEGVAESLLLPAGLCALTEALLGRRNHAARLPALACVAACGQAMLRLYGDCARTADDMLALTGKASGALAPVLSAALTLGGAEFSAMAMTPLAAACTDMIEKLLRSVGIPLCGAAAAVAVAGALSERFPLTRLFELARTLNRWLIGGAMTVFAAIIATKGLTTASRDGVALRAVKAALQGMLPIVGGEISDSATALSAGAGLLRSALGVTGAALAGMVAVRPLLRLGASAVLLRTFSAIAEPAGLREVSDLGAKFAQILEMLMALCATGAALLLLMTGCGTVVSVSIA